ncbi:MAG: hypothetical protein A2W05_01065 [Candidatus Schekmanbacteria bacterium RBG_16_38_10]|uniref:Uncharacterized protein n=1 Tax=Candidatus Schekmanbacteria bacterium RBG_16_38_10 TaxID=1817879 RepID=A0A1F7S138_9BACT|nr:MAG: hypothetical protein A2W05_01065 [Candidatus Schekmanbacteria bacterium RBG_16_38_10]
MDIIISKMLSDGRSWPCRKSKKFLRDLTRLIGRKRSSYNLQFMQAVAEKYKLMIALESAIKDGELQYVTDYLKVSGSLRDDLKMLQLPAKLIPQIVKDEDKEKKQSALDLSKLSVEELRALRKIVLKGSEQAVEEEEPTPLMIAHEPLVEENREELKVRRTKTPTDIEMEPLPIPPQGETLEEREERIRFYHWEKMMKKLNKDKGPWEE